MILIIYDIGVVLVLVDWVMVFYVGQVVEEGVVVDVLIVLVYFYMWGFFVLVFDFWFDSVMGMKEIFGILLN